MGSKGKSRSDDLAKARVRLEFPIAEAFGFQPDSTSEEAKQAWAQKHCRFTGKACEKFQQYGYGYCSVLYAAESHRHEHRVYSVCDHRLDGEPVQAAIRDFFGTHASQVQVIDEIVLTNPRASFDYVAVLDGAPGGSSAIAIETQAIDIRGGGVGPAWKAWMEGNPERWREYFTEEAKRKRRKDTVAYGVNMGNIYKRLGMQVAVKGSFLKRIGIPFYVLMQDKPFEYLRHRVPFETTQAKSWDITFMTFDYTGERALNGSLAFKQVQLVRTTLASYVEALTSDSRAKMSRQDFLDRVKRKSKLI